LLFLVPAVSQPHKSLENSQDFFVKTKTKTKTKTLFFGPRGASRPRLWSRGLHHCSLSSKGVIRGVFSANHLASNDNLTSNNQETQHKQTNVNTKVALVNNNTHTKTYANRKDRQNTRITVAFTTSATKWSGSILTTPDAARLSRL